MGMFFDGFLDGFWVRLFAHGPLMLGGSWCPIHGKRRTGTDGSPMDFDHVGGYHLFKQSDTVIYLYLNVYYIHMGHGSGCESTRMMFTMIPSDTYNI